MAGTLPNPLSDLAVAAGPKPVLTATDLAGVSLAVVAGALVALTGPGASTLLRVLAGIEAPASGHVWMAGGEHATVGVVPDTDDLVPELTVEENVLRALSRTGRDADLRWVEGLFARAGLRGCLLSRPAGLTAGERRRLAIARVLVTEPTVMFADEPTRGLDRAGTDETLWLLRDAARAYGQTTVIATRRAAVAAAADSVVDLTPGVAKDQG